MQEFEDLKIHKKSEKRTDGNSDLKMCKNKHLLKIKKKQLTKTTMNNTIFKLTIF